ncbi:Spy Predicted O-linked N-acetylglucosamine transferase, SPINDLY family [Rhabdaerophilaceae bacterium]
MKPEKVFHDAVEMQLAGNAKGAKAAYHRLLRSYPNNAVVLSNLAVIVKKEGQLAVAEQLLQRSLRANPRNVPAMATLANLRIAEKNFDAAREICETALLLEPEHADSLVNMAIVQIHSDQVDQGRISLQRALTADPNNLSAKINFANLHRLQKENVSNVATTLEGLAKEHPDNPDIHFYLAQAYHELQKFKKSLETIKVALSIENREDFNIAYANGLVTIGEFEEAIDIYEKVVRSDTQNKEVGTSFLFALNYDNRRSQRDVFLEYENFGRKLGETMKFKFDHKDREKVAGRKIRVGYLSPDFYGHVVAFFTAPIFTHQNRQDIEYFAYSNTVKTDVTTEKMKEQFDHWIDTKDMTDAQLGQRIYDDKIDVIIDLAGHTALSRVRVLAMRPAPVQATYLGYGYTTGMREIDYFIGDEFLTPEGCDEYFSEKVMRVPSPLYAYQPPVHVTPDVARLPALKNGYITFGSMSRIVRFNEGLLKVWKTILDRIPGSRLRLDQKCFEDHDLLEHFQSRLVRLGFSKSRVDLVSTNPHWHGYHQFDISLDCWPHNAGTTTMESLWMGVPVISKRDRPSVGRLGDMVLSPLGLSEWVADTEEEFVEKAVDLASDLDRLARLRFTMRDRIKNSPFMKHQERTIALETAYRTMIANYEAENP